ncbi:MAG: ferritin family protein [Nitrospirota bacterium]|nr:ferritin family protein [Nitrospirota bacterium]
MITGKEDLLKALIEAYLMEKGTNEFYTHAAEKAADASAKKTFKDLSAWEEKHMEFIQYLYQSLEQYRDMQGFEDFSRKTPSPVTEAGIPAKDLEKKLDKPEFTDDRGAITLALEIEGKAFNLYRRLSEGATDTNARAVFKEMMEQELKHVDYLKKMRDRLA